MESWDIPSLLLKLEIPHVSTGRERCVDSAGALEAANENQLSFCSYSGQKAVAAITSSRAGVVICNSSLASFVRPNPGQLLLFTDNPRLSFVRVLNLMLHSNRASGVAATAVISKNSSIGRGCSIGEFAFIGDECTVGDDVSIGPHSILAQKTVVGNKCTIQSGVVVGSDGFAFERHADGSLERFAHLGQVIIGDDVEICANASIARGSLSNTIIGSGTKIDALVHVAHNVVIGKNCELTAGSVVGGSTIIGNNCWLGLNSTLKNKIKIGNNVIIASGASVIHDVDDNDIVAGVPAKSIKNKVRTEELFLMAGQRPAQAAAS